ncbi:HdeA/HdeB family chaperone [Methylocapsa acidiphila]|uniref:HdeA/HdeB family chaperone n=1 Tax=Methylocapsa acidiphila TaxID=133552 RepID=UPI00041A6679|nr:HdeA/HdeB family chaperone [Methylocapsa acidiphila]
MKRNLFFAGALATLFAVAPATAQVTIEMSEITCKDFAGYDHDTQDFVTEWMRGYFMAKRNLTVIDSRYVKRNTEKILRYCKKLPKSSFMDAIQKNAR